MPVQRPETTPESRARHRRRLYWGVGLGLGLLALVVALNWQVVWSWSLSFWEFISDKERFRQTIESFGPWAPLVFIASQFAQVLFAPIPGELTGAVGGYTFGWFWGLIYSTIGLTLGSWLNFFLGRILGQRAVERMLPPHLLEKIDFLMERQGVLASFLLFIFPGFPKDYFSFALGLTPINWKVFMIICLVGRIPGTLLLSIQGDMVYQENYWSFLILSIVAVAIMLPVYIWRERVYQFIRWVEDGGRGGMRDGKESPTEPGAGDE